MTVFFLIGVVLEVVGFRFLYKWSDREQQWAWFYFAIANALVADFCLMAFALWHLTR